MRSTATYAFNSIIKSLGREIEEKQTYQKNYIRNNIKVIVNCNEENYLITFYRLPTLDDYADKQFLLKFQDLSLV